MNKVFLSYAHADKALAQTTIQELRKEGVLQNGELEAVDTAQTVKPGTDIRKSIKESIQDSDIVILVWSKDAALSPYVQYEVGMAKALDRPIIIARKDSAPDLPAEIRENEVVEVGRRGWGLKLIKTLMDEVEFEHVDDDPRLKMPKHIR